ncbi:heavy metal translocating P-type ATPase [Halocatena pleomorpha]|uniref:Cation-translocating P-type ATPase n=1 Tax=Halocatena pleomorpha TaxID=1785090 RepID=A0A3P3RJN4_9EURY|nr:cation-translocating P-type ATPase [Halocatena pleomorpha]RRJ33128.1 cation-translocating P-type ATPase [Halocatena pleomorpha]
MTDGTTDTVGQFHVPDMDCPSCAQTVGSALDDVSSVAEYELNPTTGQVSITFDGSPSPESAVDAIERAGYTVDHDRELRSEPVWRSSRAIKTGVSAVLAALALIGFVVPAFDATLVTVAGQSFSVSDVLFLGSVAVGGEVILSSGYRSLRTMSLDMDLLMSTAILSALLITMLTSRELYIEAASLAVLFNVAELLERYSVDRARNSLAELLELSPETAVVDRTDQAAGPDEPTEVPVEEVEVGETVIVEPGEKIPLDGVVVAGESAVDQSPVTGESVPVDKTDGDTVYAGTVNTNGYLEFETTATSEDSTITRVIDLVESAQERQTDHEQFIERFAGYYTPVVVIAALLVSAVPPLAFGQATVPWLVRGIELLVIACPCAFVISTPVTVVSGLTSAANNGVLVKGGDHLEAMGAVDVVAFDKTGTLTEGELDVTDVVPFNGHTESDVLRCARGVERRSEHPIAAAITAHAATEPAGTDHGEGIAAFETLTGRGVRADIGGHTHYAGAPTLFEELGFDLERIRAIDADALPAELHGERADGVAIEDIVAHLQAEGKTVVLVGTSEQPTADGETSDGELEGLIAVADTVRPGAAETVRTLSERGLHTVMLTGDNEGTARAVAETIGVDDYRAGLLPEEKVDAVEALRTSDSVAMIGDGINDAPALATADVGIAMGAAGSDTAIETADVALLGDDIDRLPYLAALADRGSSVIKQNIYASLAVKAVLAVLIPVFFIPVYLVILLGDVGMTLLVTGNAMRLSRLTP